MIQIYRRQAVQHVARNQEKALMLIKTLIESFEPARKTKPFFVTNDLVVESDFVQIQENQ